MFVYRHPARELSGHAVRQALLASIQRLERDPIGDCAIEALLRAGELECSLADLAHPSEHVAAYVTDAMASHVLVDNGPSVRPVERDLAALDVPAQLRLRTPAGYAHDGLDPRCYAALAPALPLREGAPIAVIGVRSIGTSLGALVSEALRLRGHAVERISVRPSGHPWARVLRLLPAELAFVEGMCARDAEFLIVDEGPFASGSTFLAVAEGIERAGVPAKSIAFCASRAPDPSRLFANCAGERWARYRTYVAERWGNPLDAEDFSAGAWRTSAYGQDAAAWPACWTQLERIKRRSLDGLWLDKFEGFAPYRDAPFDRACALAQAGYAPTPTWLGHGFVRYPWLDGRPARATDLDGQLLRELARYCAYRARAFETSSVDSNDLEQMVRGNIDEVFSVDLGSRATLEVERPIVPDARMQPFEWRIGPNGTFSKTDGHAHGDGTLLPGPTDICWDLAGAIVEWGMSPAARDQFLQDYILLSGDKPQARLPGYVLAYCAQRLGETYIAACGAEGQEQARLRNAHEQYRGELERMLGVTVPVKRGVRQRRMTREYAHGKDAA
jgi:hypothetical protein